MIAPLSHDSRGTSRRISKIHVTDGAACRRPTAALNYVVSSSCDEHHKVATLRGIRHGPRRVVIGLSGVSNINRTGAKNRIFGYRDNFGSVILALMLNLAIPPR
ncbi:hypothetical protein JG687_00006685 [Phytophthora cactorum]|uniref:Uncharacterized protein n=1 Tax=Phytophthora cactorum TaxID=29920 RepID=A0A329SRW7_9STRA|nr:hypothetical protein Pcac1_g23363 [Phytophthora cactorum]KAG2829510.1 hypothetical protein PC112_g8083 [Phytophthora cactorum]KAG2860086.1 hypothetical protein PC113_g8366 [Phytophthora cactorum]KAG2929206.1 hypothetical protein PC114_g2907 [Phytophthora cactorum]KAG2945316.1 hypothetical protein PC117_g8560 [Phytophthora cactorum]